jgi:2-polyprenyl-6-methoxyphenol hydroxylase-like FAD-dependent oxidoreductase
MRRPRVRSQHRPEDSALKIAIVGGAAAGVLASLMLGRAGHEVVVLEQDRLEPAPDVESAAASAFRPTAPQIVQPHILGARGRELLLQRLPDVYGALLAAGVSEAPVATQLPASLSDTAAWPGDERLTMLMTRRSTIDWVLQRVILAEPGVTLRCGVRVTGLLTVPGRPPRVTGVRTSQGDLAADLVIDATGRRSPIDRWLGEAGARPTATWQSECGLAYFSRHYRLRRAADLPGVPTTRMVAGLEEVTVGIWGADNGTILLALVPLAADRRFRAVKHPEVFTAVLGAVPACAEWLDVLDPISGVFPMAGLHNTMRRLVVDGVPVATGLHAVGDSVCTTNPTFGRGLSLALSGAADLLDTIQKHADDGPAQALELDRLAADHVVPFYQDQAAVDFARLAMLRHAVFGAPAPDAAPVIPDRVTYAQVCAAAPFDPAVFRAFWEIQGMIRRPDEVYTDPHVVACTREALPHLVTRSAMAQPTREQLLAALAT